MSSFTNDCMNCTMKNGLPSVLECTIAAKSAVFDFVVEDECLLESIRSNRLTMISTDSTESPCCSFNLKIIARYLSRNSDNNPLFSLHTFLSLLFKDSNDEPSSRSFIDSSSLLLLRSWSNPFGSRNLPYNLNVPLETSFLWGKKEEPEI